MISIKYLSFLHQIFIFQNCCLTINFKNKKMLKNNLINDKTLKKYKTDFFDFYFSLKI
jgi:hypothetical protein